MIELGVLFAGIGVGLYGLGSLIKAISYFNYNEYILFSLW